jgi:SPW repeat
MTAPLAPQTRSGRPARETLIGATLLIGFWFVISPWVIGSYLHAASNTWNNIVAGILIALFATPRMAREPHIIWATVGDAALGIWVFCSPWIYGYTANAGRFVNALCVGALVFALTALSGTERTTA